MKSIPKYGELTREDYAKLGYISGLEIHQQLYTEKKLFCHCPAGKYTQEHDASVLRHMRPTLSELGEYDGTALMEFKKKKDVIYLLKNETVCTYEIDDTPPFMINQDALDIAIEIALLLNCSIVGELHIIRKQYLDGSIPTGFQRTAIVGVNGWIPSKYGPNGRVNIRQLAIEEDSCREVSDIGHTITFRADRLSMPLIEIVTEPDMLTPDDCAKVAWELAEITRSTGKVRRGLGSVRQDVNVSVAGGTRVEVKGVPKIGLIPKITHYEALRQRYFLDMQEDMSKAGFKAIDSDFIEKDILPMVYESDFRNWRQAIETDGIVKAMRIRNFAPFTDFPVNPKRVFMDEVADIVKIVACIDKQPNLIWKSNALVGNINWNRIREFISAEDNDAVCVVAGSKKDVETAMQEIKARVKQAVEMGVPNETRRQVKGGPSRFERVLPGPDRMYPDTDLPPLSISEERMERIRAQAPDFTWNRKAKMAELGVSEDLIKKIFKMGVADEFEAIAKFEPSFSYSYLAHLLTASTVSLSRKGFAKLDISAFEKVIKAVKNGDFSKEACEKALGHLSIKPDTKSEDLAKHIKICELPKGQIPKTVDEICKLNKENINSQDAKGNLRYYMGKLMQKYRGSQDGQILSEKMQESLKS